MLASLGPRVYQVYPGPSPCCPLSPAVTDPCTNLALVRSESVGLGGRAGRNGESGMQSRPQCTRMGTGSELKMQLSL